MGEKEEKKSRILSVVGQSAYNYKEAPTIRLHGRWLGGLGFKIGEKVLVEEGQGYLTISKIADEPESIEEKTIVKRKQK